MDACEVNEVLVTAQDGDEFIQMVISHVLGELTDTARQWSDCHVVWPDSLETSARSIAALAGIEEFDLVEEWLTDIAVDYALDYRHSDARNTAA